MDMPDCESRVVNVTELSPPTNGEYPVIEDRKLLFIDLGDRPLDPTTTIAS